MIKRILIFMLLSLTYQVSAQTLVKSLLELNDVAKKSDQHIKLKQGEYSLEDLAKNSRKIDISGSNNVIDLRGVLIKSTVGTVKDSYFTVTGNKNTILGGELEDVYSNGLKEVIDFSAYNQDRKKLAYGLKGAAVMNVDGDHNTIEGIKLTVRGSYPYGYGSIYGIGRDQVFGLDKRCGLLVRGIGNTIDHAEIQQRAFGHAIYMQGDADKTTIKNTLIVGRVRKTAELYEEKKHTDLPFRSDYKLPLEENKPISKNEVHSLAEDGIRMYKIPGSIIVENCTVKKMRGGVRLYLGGPALVKNTTAIDCGMTNWNLPTEGEVLTSSGNFAYAPLSDFRLKRSRTKIEWTIIPSPHAQGPHNLMDILGNNQQIVLRRKKGAIDHTQKRKIVITGSNSTITNHTEYSILLEKSSSGNTIRSHGTVEDLGENNTVIMIPLK